MNEELITNEDMIKVSDDVIAFTAAMTASRVEGVADLAGGFTENITKNILRKDAPKGIKVSRDDESNGALVIDIHINVYYGYRIPEVAWEIQEKVRKDIYHLVGETAKAVNIHVEGVELKPATETEGEKTDEKN